MRVAYLTTDFGVPVLGTKGASVHVQRMVGALGQLGHEVLVITPNRGVGSAAPPGCRIEEVPFSGVLDVVYEHLKDEPIAQGNRLSKDLRNLLYAVWMEARAAEVLADFAPQALYERYTLFSTAGTQLARRFGIPHVLEVNAPLVEEQREQRGLTLDRVAEATQRFVFQHADEIVVVSAWLETYVRQHGAAPEHVTVLPNAADPDLFQPRPGPSEIRRRLGWQDQIVLVFVGAMKPWHGVPTVVEALRQLGGASSPYRLLLVGDGPDLPRVREQVAALGFEGAVHMPGAVAHHEVPDWLAAGDLALVPYTASATAYFSPVKLFECMAMGLPVVAARLGQTAEVVEQDRTGYLYSPADADEPAATIRRVAADRGAAARVGAAARQRVLERHTWRRNAECVERLVARSTTRARRAPG